MITPQFEQDLKTLFPECASRDVGTEPASNQLDIFVQTPHRSAKLSSILRDTSVELTGEENGDRPAQSLKAVLNDDQSSVYNTRKVLHSSLKLVLHELDCTNPSASTQRLKQVLRSSPASPSLEDFVQSVEPCMVLSQVLVDRRSRLSDDTLTSITKALALASRDFVWRQVLIVYEIVHLYLDALKEEKFIPDSWTGQSLRLVANCCLPGPMRSEIRHHVLEKNPFPMLVQQGLRQGETVGLSMNVIFNICDDFEPAQDIIQKDFQLALELLDSFRLDLIPFNQVQLACELLAYAPEKVEISQLFEDSINILFGLPSRYPDEVELDSLGTFVTIVLSSDPAQKLFLDSCGNVGLLGLLDFFENFHDLLVRDGECDVLHCQKTLVTTIASLASNLADYFQYEEAFPRMINNLTSGSPQIRICASLFLGNAWYSQTKIRNELKSNKILASQVSRAVLDRSNKEALTSIYDLLGNLASDATMRVRLGCNLVMEKLMSSLEAPTPDIQLDYRALFSLRQIIHGCPNNVWIFLADVNPEPRILDRLLSIYTGTSDNTKRIEVGRIIAEAWRTVHRDARVQELLELKQVDYTELVVRCRPRTDCIELVSSPALVLALRMALDDRPHIVDPIFGLVKSTNASLKTEGLLILAFMAMWREGATQICNALLNEENNDVLKSAINSVDEEVKDRSNARAVLGELQQWFADDPQRKEVLISLGRGT